MTVTEVTPITGPYSGNGSTDTFAYTFLALAEADLVVTLTDATGVDTVQTLTTHYTVTGVGNSSGGNVVMVTPPATGEKLTLSRSVNIQQLTDLQNLKSAAPEVLETAFDRLTLIAQDLQEQLGRAIQLPVSGGVSDIEVPTPSADKVIGWNAAGDALENKTINTGSYITFPVSSVDNSIPRFDGTTGTVIQGSALAIDDLGNITGVNNISGGNIRISDDNSRIGIGRDALVGLHIEKTASDESVRIGDGTTYLDLKYLTATGSVELNADGANAVAGSYVAFNIDASEKMRLSADGKLGIGDTNPQVALDIGGTDAIKIPVGTTAQRPGTPEQGHVRRNTTTGQWEGYDGAGWGSLGGAGLFRGNNGTSGDSVNGAGDIFRVNSATLTVNETIESGENASCAGPLTVNSGITLTVSGTLVIV